MKTIRNNARARALSELGKYYLLTFRTKQINPVVGSAKMLRYGRVIKFCEARGV